MRLNFIITALLLLIGIGFWGGLSVSYANLTGAQACPHLAGLAICYVVAVAYGSMLVSLFLRHTVLHHAMFFVAWGVSFLIAMLGSGLELSRGWHLSLHLFPVAAVLCLARNVPGDYGYLPGGGTRHRKQAAVDQAQVILKIKCCVDQ